MISLDRYSALCEEHRRELLAEANYQRLLNSIPKNQRQRGMLSRTMRLGWEMLLTRSGKKAATACEKEKDGMWMLVPYYPASERDVARNN